MDYKEHIELLAREHSITLEYGGTNGRAWRAARRVRTPAIKSAVTYAIALHEIGHVVGIQRGRCIDKEAQAWRWAEQNALEWTETMIKTAARSISSYLERSAEGRNGMWDPPDDHDSRRIAQWS
jgi:hypothetical protein